MNPAPAHHHELMWTSIYIAVFSAGQLLFMLVRADRAKSSPLNGVKGIGQYFSLNWVKLLSRAVIEWLLVLWPYRAGSVAFLQALIIKVWPSFPFQVPAHRGLAGAFAFGLASDLLMDYITGMPWFKSIPVLNKIVENIPQLPEVQQFVATLGPKE
jgi:hypothetical protein